jgi:hypothetical protein
MQTENSVPQPLSGGRNDGSSLLKDMIENRIKKEKKLFDEINAKFNKKREEVLKKFDIKEASNYLKKERETFDSFFDQFGENVARLEPMKKALRKKIQKNALKRFPVFRELALINAENNTNLQHGLLANFVLGDHLRGPFSDPEIFLPDDNPYREVAPPFNSSITEKGKGENGFSPDYSFAYADIGFLQHDVSYKDSNGFFDSGSSNKCAWSYVGIGSSFTISQDGMLDVIVVLKCTDNKIQYHVSDNFGPSDASLSISNLIVIGIKANTAGWLPGPDYSMMNVYDLSGGDDISKIITPIAYGSTFTFSFQSIFGPFNSGDNLEIMVSSGLIAWSALHNMDIDITGSILWEVEHIYFRIQ